MRSRCNNPNVWCYYRYGGRNIKICDRWDDFLLFVEDMWESFEEGLTLDRIDTDGDYCPENCRWATKEEQSNNKIDSLSLYFEGQYYTEAQLARKTGVNRTTIQQRRNRGWTVEEMVYGKEGSKNNKPLSLFFEGKEFSLTDLSKYTGIDKSTLRYRLFKKNLNIEEATYDRKY
jgi:lambda repressor-like predicted transcriptional regulator